MTRTEVLKVIAENEKQKFVKVISKYQEAQDINNELINQLKMKDENLNKKLDKDNDNEYKKKNSEQNKAREKEIENEKNKLKNELKEKKKIIKELNDNIQDLKNKKKKLTSLNGEYSQKIKELKSELQELKNNNKKNDESENENKAFGYKKLISVMNIGGGNEENEANEKKLEDNRPSVDRSNNGRDNRFPTARFGGDFNSNLKNKENEQNKIFNFENEYD